MSESESLELRIGDAEREDALKALGEHMSAGRLDIDEYGDRSARVATARTQNELLALFTDLPAPKPSFSAASAAPAAPAPAPVQAPQPTSGDERKAIQRVAAALLPLAWIGFGLLSWHLGIWLLMLIPLALSSVAGALWGKHWEHDQRHQTHRMPHSEQRAMHREFHQERREQHREMREQHRELRDRLRDRRRELRRGDR
ncbi:hypothetical protein GCM10010174_10690 [Kutzneria viridogrisea]|uniref:DUF1707 domain-containing protein n=2 Tax=Kutzneria TaxID=43356 RepID=W5WKD2_9PSEU|nr:DUF1707 domain-containing protein [Kutzneria albida]AHI01328.1 hypothetical protein KALB_7970 [Kutzneria albida DSM 43870]MBA8926581.1 hypothetical protein [Kutzneria viridogrisea]